MKHSERAPIYEVVQSEVSIEEAGQCTTYGIACVFTVSYTHLDVYKRQMPAFWQAS